MSHPGGLAEAPTTKSAGGAEIRLRPHPGCGSGGL